MHFAKNKLLNVARFKASLEKLDNQNKATLSLYKSTIQKALTELEQHQNQGVATANLIENFTWMIDQLVIFAWQQHKTNFPIESDIQLIAVGGYGRGELHPYSDVDLLILLRHDKYDEVK